MPRRYDIDALRIIAFSLLILYHLGMVYVPDWDFHIKSQHQWRWLQWPMIALNTWRMPLIFLISGLALGFARPERALGKALLGKSWRLVLPLVFGIVAIVPIQAYCEARLNGAVPANFVAFMLRYLQFRPWPAGSFAGAEYGVTWNHLWYLAYLWCYTLVLLGLIPLCRWLCRLGSSGPPRLPPGWGDGCLLLCPPLYFFALMYWLEPMFPPSYALVGDWFLHALYLPLFVFGYAVARSYNFWQAIGRRYRAALVLALLGLTVSVGLHTLGELMPPAYWAHLPDLNWPALASAGRALYLWTALLALLGLGQRYLNRPFGWLGYSTEAVYPWYVLHQSLLVPLAFYLAPLGLSGWLEAGTVLLATLIGCTVLHHWVIRPTAWLRPLFGLRPLPYPSMGCQKRSGLGR